MNEKYTVIAYSPEGVGTIMAVWGDLLHAVQNADVLRQDGYEAVNVKRFKEVG